MFFYFEFVRPHRISDPVLVVHCIKDIGKLEHVYRRAVDKEPKREKTYEELLEELGMFSLEKKSLLSDSCIQIFESLSCRR